MPPSKPDGAAMDQSTGPPFAVRVIVPLWPTMSDRLCVDTLSVPWAGADEPDDPDEPDEDPDEEDPEDEDPDELPEEPDEDEPDDGAVLVPLALAEEPPDDTGTVEPPLTGSADGLAAGPATAAGVAGLACLPLGCWVLVFAAGLVLVPPGVLAPVEELGATAEIAGEDEEPELRLATA